MKVLILNVRVNKTKINVDILDTTMKKSNDINK